MKQGFFDLEYAVLSANAPLRVPSRSDRVGYEGHDSSPAQSSPSMVNQKTRPARRPKCPPPGPTKETNRCTVCLSQAHKRSACPIAAKWGVP